MNNETVRDEDRLRNPMTVRWGDEDFRTVADEAWRRRMSTSALMRQLVRESLSSAKPEVAP